MSPLAPIKNNVIEAIAIVDGLRNQLWQILEHIESHLCAKYECSVEGGKASPASRLEAYNSKYRMDNLLLQPGLQAREGTIFVEVWIEKPQRDDSQDHSAFSAVDGVNSEFRDQPWGKRRACIPVDAIALPSGFFESSGIEDQANLVCDWVDRVLAPLVTAGLIKTK